MRREGSAQFTVDQAGQPRQPADHAHRGRVEVGAYGRPLAPAIWGTTYLVTSELLPPDRPLLAAVVRALPAGLLLTALTRRLPRGDWWWRSLVLGTLNIGAFFALLFVAAYRLPGGVAATVGAIQPVLVACLSAGLLGERLRTRTIVAGAAGVAGVSLLVLRADARLDALGVVAAVGGAAVMATGVVLAKRWRSPAPLLATTGWQLVAGGLVLLPLLFTAEGLPPALTATNLAGYAYLSVIGAALAYTLWFGATGAVGREVVAEAAARGHEVRPASRATGADATDVAAVTRLSAGQDLVVTATRPRPGREPELVAVTHALLTALRGTGIRLLVVGAPARC